jgi:hypothetical protein
LRIAARRAEIERGAGSRLPRRLSLALHRPLASPSLQFFLSHWDLISVDEQAIALAVALAAYTPVAQS